MQYKKFILSVTDDGVQEAELNKFLRSHRVLKVESNFVPSDAYWAMLVSYMDGDPEQSAPPAKRNKSERTDPIHGLTAEEKSRYDHYVGIRLTIARREGVKAFHVFTNSELASMARIFPLTLSAIAAIEGIGPKRAEQYGAEFLSPIATDPIITDPNEASRIFDAADSPY